MITAKQLKEFLETQPDEAIVMLSDPCENSWALGSMGLGTTYVINESKDDDDDEKEVPAVWLQAVWEH